MIRDFGSTLQRPTAVHGCALPGFVVPAGDGSRGGV